ncbi:hypothetical protein PENARI_c138G04623 [Penicillium arizonense]|nr:hypothetical protein PENARI_c283G03385 [Penicillium arizonense]XP_022482152.1 hypothetical protein PENARI_c138G04623 [Penicillium arizonense]OGE46417.1 hypothetical protein PENARI_c283G03385 [Penicillium arizonense]OGE46684.1 hypothetical protein PENARI_c138G04623 [Penicillium arizonense]
MTTGGIDESLPRPSPSRFGSSDHALNGLLAAWIPGVQWVTIVVVRWHLASFEPETPKKPGEANALSS